MIFQADTVLYHPTEGKRVFPKGEQHPGAAWFDNPECKRPEPQKLGPEAIKAYEDTIASLERKLGIQTASLASAAGRAEAAEAKVKSLENELAAVRRDVETNLAAWSMAIKERDQSREYAAGLERQIAAFDHDGDGKPGGRRKAQAAA